MALLIRILQLLSMGSSFSKSSREDLPTGKLSSQQISEYDSNSSDSSEILECTERHLTGESNKSDTPTLTASQFFSLNITAQRNEQRSSLSKQLPSQCPVDCTNDHPQQISDDTSRSNPVQHAYDSQNNYRYV